jgi:hypothetical protein
MAFCLLNIYHTNIANYTIIRIILTETTLNSVLAIGVVRKFVSRKWKNPALFWGIVIGPSFSDAGTTSLEGGPLEVKDNSNAELMPWTGNKWVFSVWRLLHSFTRKKKQFAAAHNRNRRWWPDARPNSPGHSQYEHSFPFGARSMSFSIPTFLPFWCKEHVILHTSIPSLLVQRVCH